MFCIESNIILTFKIDDPYDTCEHFLKKPILKRNG